MTQALRLEAVIFGKLDDPAEHPRWDGERIRPYGETIPAAGDANEREDDQ